MATKLSMAHSISKRWSKGQWAQALFAMLLSLIIHPDLSHAQPKQPEDEARVLSTLQYYLESNCGVIGKTSTESELSPLKQLLQFAASSVLQTKLTEILMLGLDVQVKKKAEKRYEERWSRLSARIAKHQPKALPREKIISARMTQEVYVRQRVERLTHQYKEKAAVALAAIAAQTDSKEIEQTLKDAGRTGDQELLKIIEAAREHFAIL